MEQIYNRINELAAQEKWDEIERFLTGCMEEAREAEAHGKYVALGNELLTFYRETGAFQKAMNLSDDILLLMEEFQQEHTENFAYIMINVAASYSGAGRFAEAESYYSRAIQILEEGSGREAADEAAQKYFDVYYVTALCGKAEAAYRQGNTAGALNGFEKAAFESGKRNGAGEGTRILWQNCAALADVLLRDAESADEKGLLSEKKRYYEELLA